VRREIARAQRILEGQNLEIRRTLASYSGVVEEQHRRLVERRQALLLGDEAPDVWVRAPEQRAILVAATGERAVVEAEVAVTLGCIDRAWRDHLTLCADLREGIHLVRLGGQDPLTRFTSEAIQAFSKIDDTIDDAVLTALMAIRVDRGGLDLTGTGLKAPSSTWTYLVNDDPFKNRLGALLTGAGGAAVAIYAAVVMMPLLILWGLVERLWRRSTRRRTDPFGR
jgi:preprotein translocase subunit SecA